MNDRRLQYFIRFCSILNKLEKQSAPALWLVRPHEMAGARRLLLP